MKKGLRLRLQAESAFLSRLKLRPDEKGIKTSKGVSSPQYAGFEIET